jgi:hypothetical protein
MARNCGEIRKPLKRLRDFSTRVRPKLKLGENEMLGFHAASSVGGISDFWKLS